MLEKAVWVSRQPDMHSVIGRQPVVSQQGTGRQKTQTRQHFADLGGSNGWRWSRQPDWWPGWTHGAVLAEPRAVLGPQPDGHLAPDVGEQPGQGEGVDNYRSDMRLFIKHHVFEFSSADDKAEPKKAARSEQTVQAPQQSEASTAGMKRQSSFETPPSKVRAASSPSQGQAVAVTPPSQQELLPSPVGRLRAR